MNGLARIVAISGAVIAVAAFRPPTLVDPCSLVTKSEVMALVGGVTATSPSGPEPDENTGGSRSLCVYQSAKMIFVVSVISFSSASQASKALTEQMVRDNADNADSVTVAEEKGLGERAYWAYGPRGASYIVLRGSNVLGIGLTGQDFGGGERHRAALRGMVSSAMGKLQIGVFIGWPWLALIPGAGFAALYLASRRATVAVTAGAWLLYGLYEYGMKARWLCTGECNIRVDLLLLYPMLALASIGSLFIGLRAAGRRRSRPTA